MPRLIQMTTLPTVRRSLFVGRMRELEEFGNSINALLTGDQSPAQTPFFPHIFLISGADGMGKTSLVREFLRVAAAKFPPQQIIHLDLSNQHIPTIDTFIEVLAKVIRQHHPDFDKRYKHAATCRITQGPRYQELQRQWVRWEFLCQNSAANSALLESHRRTAALAEQHLTSRDLYPSVYVEAQERLAISELTALSSFRDTHGSPPASFEALLQHEFGADAKLLQQDEELWRAFIEDLYELVEAAPLVLAIDGYEQAERYDGWLRTQLLTQSSDRMLTVIASRDHLNDAYFHTFGSLATWLIRSYDLDEQPLQPPEIQHYLRQLYSTPHLPGDLVEQVAMKSGGLPVVLEALGNQLSLYGELTSNGAVDFAAMDRNQVVDAVTTYFLNTVLESEYDNQAIPDSKLLDRQRIRALALLLRPDIGLICALWGVPRPECEPITSQLAERYTFMFASETYVLQQAVRKSVRSDTYARGRNASDWTSLEKGLRRCLKLIHARIVQLERDLTDLDKRYSHSGWRHSVLELINVLLWIGEDKSAMRRLLNHWIEARCADPAMADTLIDLAAELAPQTSNWALLVQALRAKDRYQLLAPFVSLLVPQTQAVLFFLRARQVQDVRGGDGGGNVHINHRIMLLEQGYQLDNTWKRLKQALAEAYADQGRLRTTQNAYARALTDLDHALKLWPDVPDWLYLRSITKGMLGDLEGALVDLNQALAMRPHVPDLLFLRGVTKGSLQDIQGALADFERALTANPNDSDMLYLRGVVKGILGDLQGALADLDQALSPDADPSYERLYKRGLIKGAVGDLEGALADFDRVLIRNPDTPETLYRRGLIKDRLGDLEGALADYNRFLVMRADDADALSRRGIIKERLGSPSEALFDFERVLAMRPDDPNALYWRGVVKTKLHDYNQALADFNRVSVLRPNDPDALHHRGIVKRLLGDIDGALADFDLVLTLRPDDPQTLHQRGIIKTGQGYLGEALDDFDRAVAMNPDDAEMYYLRAMTRSGIGDTEGALADFDYVAKQRPEDANVFCRRGVVRSEVGDLAGALADFDQALSLRPKDSETLYHRGVTRSEVGDLAGALADFDRVLELRPDNPHILLQRGIVRSEAGDVIGALADFDRALSLRPDDPDILLQRGIVRSAAGDLQGALADFNWALSLRPDDPNTLLQRGITHNEAGHLQHALADFDQLLAFHLNDPDTLYYRGIVKDRLGDKMGALADFNLVLALRPNDADAFFQRGLVNNIINNKRGALADFDWVLTLRPEHVDALRNRGIIRSEMGDFTSALADFNCAIELFPDDRDLRYQRAKVRGWLSDLEGALSDYDWVLARYHYDIDSLQGRGFIKRALGDLRGALVDYDRVLARRPKDVDALSNRGDIKQTLGDLAGALDDFDQALKNQPDDHELMAKHRVLKKKLRL
ncbi:MAG: tetratricopeptide repeat protein [Chloroflexales bacterium]|nr:tetratricopeptide repeat protein [Chloroflexales bacterium]